MQINLTVGKIKRIIGAKCSLDDSFLIKKITSLEIATQNDLAVVFDGGEESVFDSIEEEKIKSSNAGLIISESEVVKNKNYLFVDDALKAFIQLVNFIQFSKKENCNVHPSAVVDKTCVLQGTVDIAANAVIQANVTIGESSFIGANSFIGKNVTIGSHVKIYANVTILDGSKIGNNCIIHSGSIIGSDGFGYSVSKIGLVKIPQIGIVEIGNNVEIGACCTIDRASFEKTIIGDGVKLDNHIHVAHNVKIGSHTIIIAQTGIAGGTKIGYGCQIGGQVAIRDHIKIGNKVKIVSKSAVMRNLKDGAVVSGIPAIPFLQWKRMSVILTKLPEFMKDFYKLKSIVQKFKAKRGFWNKIWG
ncbi:UDP-3-O-(3-hydroxymyristoyl)glucosamine N-acyltransferase [Candidatus Dependentiae bacterium]